MYLVRIHVYIHDIKLQASDCSRPKGPFGHKAHAHGVELHQTYIGTYDCWGLEKDRPAWLQKVAAPSSTRRARIRGWSFNGLEPMIPT